MLFVVTVFRTPFLLRLKVSPVEYNKFMSQKLFFYTLSVSLFHTGYTYFFQLVSFKKDSFGSVIYFFKFNR